MARKVDADVMVRGMGMGMKVLQTLIEATTAEGVEDFVFGLMTKPRFKGNLESIAKAIAACDWRIPASEMRRRAAKSWRGELRSLEPDEVEQAVNLWWTLPCIDLGIPCERYCQDPNHGDPAVPPMLLELIHGKVMKYPLIIESGHGPNSRREVVVNWGTKDNLFFEIGDVIDATKIEHLAIARAVYFDFEK